MGLSFFNDTVTVKRAPVKTSRGSTVPDWDNAQTHAVARCLVTRASTYQDRDGRVLESSDRLTLRAPYGADIEAGDRIIWNGCTYEIEGTSFSTASPAGGASNLHATLAIWKG